ncbi:MAG: hypothetical protein AAF802_06150 [Planctomycetota bacterium]
MLSVHRVRFSIRALLSGTFLIAVAIACFYVGCIREYRRDAATVIELEAIGAKTHSNPREPQWLWSTFGTEVGQRCTSIILSGTDVSDEQIVKLQRLRDLQSLYLDKTAVTDDGLTCLSGMEDLVALSLRRTNISKLPSLSHMQNLVDLDVSFTSISNIDLSGLGTLQTLALRSTLLDDASLAKFPPLPELESLDISGTPGQPVLISDRGIETITFEKFPKLKSVYLYDCDVSDAQVDRIRSEFPGVKLFP